MYNYLGQQAFHLVGSNSNGTDPLAHAAREDGNGWWQSDNVVSLDAVKQKKSVAAKQVLKGRLQIHVIIIIELSSSPNALRKLWKMLRILISCWQ